MQSYNKLFIKQLFFNTENGDEVRKKTAFTTNFVKNSKITSYYRDAR